MAKKYHHLSFEDRQRISIYLDFNYKLKDIASLLDKAPSSISREIKRNRYIPEKRRRKDHCCGLFNSCIIKHLCNQCLNGICKFCRSKDCVSLCASFTSFPDCSKILSFPFVCNSCIEIKDCKLPKFYYNYKIAQSNYSYNVSHHKEGISISNIELARLNDILVNGIKKRQSIPIILKVNNLNYSPSTIYSWTRNKKFDFDLLDLKRVVNRKPTKSKKASDDNQVKYDYLSNRTYDDFINYLSTHEVKHIWELDVLEGKKGSKTCVLSLLHRATNLQLYFRMKSQSQKEVKRVFDMIKKNIGLKLFGEIFEIILTDNGSEFKDPISIEKDYDYFDTLVHVFYCKPRRSDQKGKCEKNHVHFRDLVPKGVDVTPYTDEDINFISNQVNNYSRASLDFNSPFQKASEVLNKKVLRLNDLTYISPNEVNLSKLIK